MLVRMRPSSYPFPYPHALVAQVCAVAKRHRAVRRLWYHEGPEDKPMRCVVVEGDGDVQRFVEEASTLVQGVRFVPLTDGELGAPYAGALKPCYLRSRFGRRG